MAKVLLIEDDDIMVDLLTTLLQIEGFEVASVREQDDTLDIIRREAPDVVLLDVHLRSQTGQDVDGFELLKRIRSDEKYGAAKVIMSSGIDFQEKCQQAGANAFILKPYMPNALIALIKQTIN